MEAKLMLWICTAACFWWSTTSSSIKSLDHFPSFLRKIVSEEDLTVPISGPNGYCVDVIVDEYPNNPVFLGSCEPRLGANTLWTFMRDGTIRSGAKCLTSDSLSQGSNITTDHCPPEVTDRTLWSLRDDGEILNPKSGLVLTSLPATEGTVLTLEQNISSSFQTWRADNNTGPYGVRIVGYEDLCMLIRNNTVWAAKCPYGPLEKPWYLFSDGTIRPEQDKTSCLGYDNLIHARVVTMSCGLGPSSERWLFRRQHTLPPSYTILNPRTGLVLTVRDSESELKEIVVSPPTGGANQTWNLDPDDLPEGLSKPK